MKILITILGLFIAQAGLSQENISQWGGWYLYHFNTKINDQWGIAGDFQFLNWDFGSDNQLLIGTIKGDYSPTNSNMKFSLGYMQVSISDRDPSDLDLRENRIIQQIHTNQTIFANIQLKHKFQYEQRFVENQDFRTRWRYKINTIIPFDEKEKNHFYATLAEEIFINGQKDIGVGRTVPLFDQNRLYGGVGMKINNKLKVHTGVTRFSTEGLNQQKLQIDIIQTF